MSNELQDLKGHGQDKGRTLNTPAALKQGSDVPLDGALAGPLVADEVRVMRARDKVLRKWAGHVVRDPCGLLAKDAVIRGGEEGGEAVEVNEWLQMLLLGRAG